MVSWITLQRSLNPQNCWTVHAVLGSSSTVVTGLMTTPCIPYWINSDSTIHPHTPTCTHTHTHARTHTQTWWYFHTYMIVVSSLRAANVTDTSATISWEKPVYTDTTFSKYQCYIHHKHTSFFSSFSSISRSYCLQFMNIRYLVSSCFPNWHQHHQPHHHRDLYSTDCTTAMEIVSVYHHCSWTRR